MINLLPPAIKEEIAYSKRNAIIRNYTILTVVVALVLGGGLVGARYYVDQQIGAAEQRISAKQQELAHYKSLSTQAVSLSSRLTTIQTIQKNQAKFSILLNDLAQDMPKGTAISSITLTGDDKKPVRLTVTATDYKTALSFRDSITASKRVSAADIEDIKQDPAANPPVYRVTVTFTFNPGEAR